MTLHYPKHRHMCRGLKTSNRTPGSFSVYFLLITWPNDEAIHGKEVTFSKRLILGAFHNPLLLYMGLREAIIENR